MKNYGNEESLVKRFLKRKIKITLGFVVAFMIMGTGVFAAEPIIGTKTDIKEVKIGETEGYTVGEDKNLNITLNTQSKTGTDYAEIDLNGNNLVIEINESAEEDGSKIYRGIADTVITGNSQNKGNITLVNKSKEDFDSTGIYAQREDVEIKNAGDITIDGFEKGISTSRKKVIIKSDSLKIENFKEYGIKAIGNDGSSSSIDSDEELINIETGNLIIKSENADDGINSTGRINIKSENSVDIVAKENGIYLANKGKAWNNIARTSEISADTINIKATGSTGKAIQNKGDYSATINLSAKNITLEGSTAILLSGRGVLAKQETPEGGGRPVTTYEQVGNHININADEKIVINGEITVSADKISDEVENKNNNSININTDTTKNPDVIINGNIFSMVMNGVGTGNTVNLRLATENSKFTGYTGDWLSGTTYQPANVNLELSNGAEWEAKGYKYSETNEVTSLNLNGGVITAGKDDSGREDGNGFVNIKVGELSGEGGTLNITASVDEETGKAQSGIFEIGEVTDDNAHFNINYQGTDNLETDKDKAEKVFGELAENIKVEKGEFNASAKLEEGFVSKEYTSEFVKDENGNIVVKDDSVKMGNLNSMVQGMKDLATINLLTWRQEMNSLNKRMGELRNSTGEHGVWSRVYAGKIENGSQYDNEYQSYQVGYDKKYSVDNGTVFVGALVSYTDGETNYKLGSGENYSVGAGVYATWLNNDGQFADIILKQSRLHNKFDVTSKDGDKSQQGDYNNWGTSLSGQYGKRFNLNEKFFVEPSAELTLGRVDAVDYTTSADVKVHQDSMYSLVGNIGTAVGYKFSDKGNVYARASLVKEFQGDIDTEYRKDGAVEKTNEDLSDTWAEFGIGVNYRFVENFNIYADIQKTGDATVDTEWQGNLGFRYEF